MYVKNKMVTTFGTYLDKHFTYIPSLNICKLCAIKNEIKYIMNDNNLKIYLGV